MVVILGFSDIIDLILANFNEIIRRYDLVNLDFVKKQMIVFEINYLFIQSTIT